MKRKPKEDKTKATKDIILKVINENGDSLMDEEDMSLLAKKFSKLLSKLERNKGKNLIRSRYKEYYDNGIICYKFKKIIHI